MKTEAELAVWIASLRGILRLWGDGKPVGHGPTLRAVTEMLEGIGFETLSANPAAWRMLPSLVTAFLGVALEVGQERKVNRG